MPLELKWPEVILRLVLTLIAGSLIGLDRGEHGKTVGLRTTVLVALAASVTMILVNFLFSMTGKASDSFVTMDVMRLPLGILSGIGFIGGGAILKNDNRVRGVTTAATLWFTTVIGLCLGCGQTLLGLTSLGLALFVLMGLKIIERYLKHDLKATLVLTMKSETTPDSVLAQHTDALPFKPICTQVIHDRLDEKHELQFELKWRGHPDDVTPPAFLAEISKRPDVLAIRWTPQEL